MHVFTYISLLFVYKMPYRRALALGQADVYNIPYRRSSNWPKAECTREQRYHAYKPSGCFFSLQVECARKQTYLAYKHIIYFMSSRHAKAMVSD